MTCRTMNRRDLLKTAGAAVGLAARGDSATQRSRPPNIVLILADDLGINDLGCYGRADHRTPHLDRLASQGLRFTSAYASAPVCSPSRTSLLTGKHPARVHLTTFLAGRRDAPSQKLLHPKMRMELPLEEMTLAEALKPAGYGTACIGKWHLGGEGFGPLQQGFDVAFAGKADTSPSESEGGKGEYGLTARAEEFVTASRERPFFLYLAHNNPHIPLAAKSGLVEKNRAAFNPLYAAIIETLDDSVGRILARIDALGLRDDTIVIFTSDNGGLHVPELRDDAPTHNTPFRAGKGFLYEGGLRVPLIIRMPGQSTAGRVTGVPVALADLMPTLLSLAGAPAPAGLDGQSLAALLTSGEPPRPRPLYWHYPHYSNQGSRPAGAVRDGNWKMIEYYEDGRVELFDLSRDPGEGKDLAPREPNRVRAMRSQLSDWKRQVGAQENTVNPAFDASLHRQLYIDTDVSRLKPVARSADMTPRLASWRRLMDSVVKGW